MLCIKSPKSFIWISITLSLTLVWLPIVTLSGVIPNVGGPSQINNGKNKYEKHLHDNSMSWRVKVVASKTNLVPPFSFKWLYWARKVFLYWSVRPNKYTILVHCRSIWVICVWGLETREKARLCRAFSRASRRIHIFTYMLRQCTCIVFILQF